MDQLLSDQPNENRLEQIFTILQNVAKSVRDNQASLSSLVITKQLSKNPNEYPDTKQAHVQVALRLNKEGGRMWKVGDTVPYIICSVCISYFLSTLYSLRFWFDGFIEYINFIIYQDGTEKSATERAYHIDEYKKSDSLKIDVNYYLLNQVLPIALRICEPIEGIDDVLLAENLGIISVYINLSNLHKLSNVCYRSEFSNRFRKYI